MVRPPAASMVGMPTRKENSVAAGRFKPSNSASKIVEPERDEPGKTAAINWPTATAMTMRSEEHTSELQSLRHLVCRLLLEKNTLPQSLGQHHLGDLAGTLTCRASPCR